MKGLIVAVSPEGAIGLAGKIPWHYKGDLRRFKRVTMDSTIVMGRITWESIGQKPLPGRRNVVIASGGRLHEGADCFTDVPSALVSCSGTVWFIGGRRIYEEALKHVDILDVTFVPDHVDHPDAVRFPPIDTAIWEAGPELVHEDEPTLRRRVFTRRSV